MAANTHDAIGEGPLWVAEENSVYWVDLLAPGVRKLHLDTGKVDIWPMPDLIGWLVTSGTPGAFVAGMRTGVFCLTLDPVVLTPLLDALHDRPCHRLNDGKVAPDGRIWFGTMQEEGATDTGRLLMLQKGGSLICVDKGYRVSNGPTFSVDGKYLYHADSLRHVVYRYEITEDGVQNRQVFAEFPADWGMPDGMTTDVEGGIWISHWDGHCVSRFDLDGKRERVLRLPVSRVTSCVFGGASLDRMFVTSAAQDRHYEPLAGALFEVEPGIRGMAPTAYDLHHHQSRMRVA